MRGDAARFGGDDPGVFSVEVEEFTLFGIMLVGGSVGDSSEGDDSLDAEPTSQSSSPHEVCPTVILKRIRTTEY